MTTNAQKTNSIWIGVALSIVLLLLFAAPQRAVAQWTASGNNISNTNTGNVGVGTTSPGKHLTVNGDAGITTLYGNSTSQNANDSLKLGPGSNGNFFIDNIGAGGLAQTIIGFNTTKTAGANGVFSIFNNSTDRNLLFMAQSAGTGSGSNQVVFPAGNVGIGTTSPGAKLDLSGSTFLQYVTLSDATSYGAISFRETGGSSKGHIGMTGSGSGSTYIGGANAFQIWNGQNTPMVFGTNGSERVRIDASGNVGIGTTTPGYKLDVAGRIRSSADGFMFPDGTVQLTASPGGTITGVTAGAGLTGGGTSGSVTLTNDDRGSSQNIFKNVANASGTTQFSAGSNSDGIRFAGSNGTSVTFDAATKKVIIDGSTSTPSAGNISAGQFGQNTGGGNYTFPGNVTVNGNIAAKYQDVAEWVPSSEQLPAATVVVLDSTKSNQVIASSVSYDTRVAGVISEQPGIALGERGANKVLVATTGRVRVKVDASRAPIHIGDLLVTSDIPGLAMKSEPVNLGGIQLHRPGTLIGKALEPLAKGKGEILVLLSLQ